MAYITQYEIDKSQDRERSRNLDGVVAGVGMFAKNFEENRRRAVDEKRAMEELELKKGQAQKDEVLYKNKLEIDDLSKQEKTYGLNQLKMPVQQRDDYIKSIDSAKARNDFVAERMNAQEQNKIEAEQRALNNKKQDALQKVAIPDYDIADPEVIPTQKDAEEIKKLNASNKSFQGLGQSVAEKLGKADPRNPAYYVGNDWKLLQQDLTKMKLQAKNLEDLGVLNGPDLSLVNETLGAITPATLAILGKDKAADRIKAALGNSQKVLENAASSRGYKPKSKLAPEDDAAINWAKANANDPRAQQILQLHGAK